MKRILIFLALIYCSLLLRAQTNTYPASGNVGIGTTTPQSLLHLKNGSLLTSDGTFDNINAKLDGNFIPALRFTRWTGSGSIQNNAYVGQFYNSTLGEYSFGLGTGSSSSGDQNVASTALMITVSGNIGINTTNTLGYKLAVNGSAIFTKAVVKQYGNWPDYVFSPNYRLSTLKELEDFIKRNSHLPDIPSTKEVEEKGLDLADNQALLLKKIEELTLYIIDLNKEVRKLKEQNEAVKKKNVNSPNQ